MNANHRPSLLSSNVFVKSARVESRDQGEDTFRLFRRFSPRSILIRGERRRIKGAKPTGRGWNFDFYCRRRTKVAKSRTKGGKRGHGIAGCIVLQTRIKRNEIEPELRDRELPRNAKFVRAALRESARLDDAFDPVEGSARTARARFDYKSGNDLKFSMLLPRESFPRNFHDSLLLLVTDCHELAINERYESVWPTTAECDSAYLGNFNIVFWILYRDTTPCESILNPLPCDLSFNIACHKRQQGHTCGQESWCNDIHLVSF